MTTREDDLPEEIEADVNGIRTIVTSEGVVFTGSIGQVLSEPVEELRFALEHINRLGHEQGNLLKENQRLREVAQAILDAHARRGAVLTAACGDDEAVIKARQALQPNEKTTR